MYTAFPGEYLDPTTGKPIPGGFRKIADLPESDRCRSKQHNPLDMIVLQPGIYEYTCPDCGHVTTFTVRPWSEL